MTTQIGSSNTGAVSARAGAVTLVLGGLVALVALLAFVGLVVAIG